MTINNDNRSELSRRKFIKTSAAIGVGAALSGSIPFASAQAGDVTLKMWWWGEQELPGLQAFVDDSVAKYSAAKIETMLQDTSVVISQFQTAAAASEAPDIQYFWNGIYHMESVWFGYVRPVNGLVNDDVIKSSSPTLLSNYDGNVHRVGWYPIPMCWYYNKDMFDKAGLDADNPPLTWEELLNTCDILKSKGMEAVGGGIQDGYWGEWYFAHGLAQSIDSPGDAVDLFIGELDWMDPKYHELWTRLEELKNLGYLNKDMSSLELYPGIDLIVEGKLAMGESIGTRLPADSKTTGGQIGTMVMPTFGKGKMAGVPILDVQGLGISADSKNPEAAAAFLEYLHTPERLQAFWDITGWIPSSTSFDTDVIKDAAVKGMWEKWGLGENIPYVGNLAPGQFYEQAIFPVGQEIVQGNLTGEQAGELSARVVKEWRDFNPDLIEKYKKWAVDLR